MDRLLLARARYVVAIAAILAGFFVIGLAAQAPSAAAGGPVGGSITPAAGSVLAAPTTAHTGRIHVYDALVIARVHVRTVGTVDLAPAMLGDQWERSAPLPSELRGVSTTSLRSGVATNTVDDVFHCTKGEFVDSISTNGLRPGSYATPNGGLSPLQAQIDLALPPNTGLRDAVMRVDVAGLREAGYEIPAITRVTGTVTGPGGRVYTMPGGGYEMQFPYAIPPEFIKVVTP